ncbi:MAG: hypothetical protein GX347_06740 [Epulopiscium sp.]|nr:hypothetical protein [Candidatus Epulonipiscium sp.]
MKKIDKETLTILGWGVGLGLLLYYIPPLLRKKQSILGISDLTVADISNKGTTKDMKNVNKSIKQIDKFLKDNYKVAISLLFDNTKGFLEKDNTLNDLLKTVNDLRNEVFIKFKTDKQDELIEAINVANEYLVNKYGFSFNSCMNFINNITNVSKESRFLNFQNEKKFYEAMANIKSLEMGQIIGTLDKNIVNTIKSFVNDSQIKKGLTALPIKTKLQLYNFIIV